MRITKQKKILEEALSHFHTFFNAEDFHAHVIKKGIGIATVYRFLNTQEEQGLLHSFMCKNRKIYSLSQKNHIHFRCEHCGKIQHLTHKKLDFLGDITGEVCHVQIDIAGVCETCKKRLK
ncbi:MAG: transcriptional repressor [Nanoarchaeota archaeon]|mgnify:FL=1